MFAAPFAPQQFPGQLQFPGYQNPNQAVLGNMMNPLGQMQYPMPGFGVPGMGLDQNLGGMQLQMQMLMMEQLLQMLLMMLGAQMGSGLGQNGQGQGFGSADPGGAISGLGDGGSNGGGSGGPSGVGGGGHHGGGHSSAAGGPSHANESSSANVDSRPGAPGTEALLGHANSMVGLEENRDRAKIQEVTGRSGINPSTTPWCAAFAINLMKEHGVLDTSGLSNPNYCPTIKSWAKDKGNYGAKGSYNPKAGDAILFDWNHDGTTDHIGIVEKVSNGKVYTIEGNSSNQVKKNSYDLGSGSIDGYVVSGKKK